MKEVLEEISSANILIVFCWCCDQSVSIKHNSPRGPTPDSPPLGTWTSKSLAWWSIGNKTKGYGWDI